MHKKLAPVASNERSFLGVWQECEGQFHLSESKNLKALWVSYLFKIKLKVNKYH